MIWDLLVIGGGPAGMMAAGRAAENGARVLLLERNDKLGLKLLITGHGRCNITNTELSSRNLVEKFGPQGKFLFSALHRFGPSAVIEFFNSRGLKTKVEKGNLIFPAGDRADQVLQVLIDYLKQNKVKIRTKAEVKSIVCLKGKIIKIVLANSGELAANSYAICAGGKSYPLTGSRGESYNWLAQLGHTIVRPRPALAPIIVEEKWVKDLEGVSLRDVSVSIRQNNKKVMSRVGDALFTNNGLSGPVIFNLSKKVGELAGAGQVELVVDFLPDLDLSTTDKLLQKNFSSSSNKMLKNSWDLSLSPKLIAVLIRLSSVDPDKKVNLVTKEERKKILSLLKDFRLKIRAVGGFSQAMVTAGGVDLKEVDPQTMHSKIISNLYLAGEVLDLDGPTGGYNLQSCWSTGFMVGENFKSYGLRTKDYGLWTIITLTF